MVDNTGDTSQMEETPYNNFMSHESEEIRRKSVNLETSNEATNLKLYLSLPSQTVMNNSKKNYRCHIVSSPEISA